MKKRDVAAPLQCRVPAPCGAFPASAAAKERKRRLRRATRQVPVELQPASGARVSVPSPPAGTCPVCFGYCWHPVRIEKLPHGFKVELTGQRCACCGGTGNIGRRQRRHSLVKWIEGR